MRPQSTVSYLGWFQSFFQANHLGSVLALSFSLFLAACGGGGNTVTENDLPEPAGADGIAPTLEFVEIKQSGEKFATPGGFAKLGQNVQINFRSSEALMKPEVMINDRAATVTGSITNWSAMRMMDETDVDGVVTFKISFTDISGEAGVDVTSVIGNVDGEGIEYESSVEYCAEGCVAPVADPILGEWKLDGEGAAGVGPNPLDKQWWSSTSNNGAGPDDRPCWFDDSYVFSGGGSAGSFANETGGLTLVGYQGGAEDVCAAPEAPHDGSSAATFSFEEGAGIDGAIGELTLSGRGAYIGLAKATNGAQITSAAAAPESVTYQVMSLSSDGLYMTVTLETDSGVWWTFDLAKVPPSPVEGAWVLDGEGAAGVGPNPLDKQWWSSTSNNGAGPDDRPCWFDDTYVFGSGGTFSNEMGGKTLVGYQGGAEDICATPVAPHDGSGAATFSYEEGAGAIDGAIGELTLNGRGAFIGLAKATNGAQIASAAAAPESVTYQVMSLSADGLYMTVTLETDAGVWWTFDLVKVPPSPLAGAWLLDGEGAAGVGPNPLDKQWWSSTSNNGAGPDDRPCWFDDSYDFGAGGSFSNETGGLTLVGYQGGAEDICAAPEAPHDGSAAATHTYVDGAGSIDGAIGELTLNGRGAYIGLAKATNGAQITSAAAAPDSITYQVMSLSADGLYMTVTLETDSGVCLSFNLV